MKLIAPVRAPRIVSLLPSNTEMVYALGLESRLVAVSHECDWPPSVAQLPRVTRSLIDSRQDSAGVHQAVRRAVASGQALFELDAARIRALRPDLILTQAQCAVCAVDRGEVDALAASFARDARPRVLAFQPASLQDALRDLETLGAAAGTERAAAAYVRGLRERIWRVVRAQMWSEPVPTLMLEWLDPPMPGGCWTPELIMLAGGEPLLQAENGKARSRTWDEIAACGAQVLVLSPCGLGRDRALRELDALLARPAVAALPAVANGRVYLADGNALFNRPGPRLVDTLETLAHMLHPESARERGIPCLRGLAWAWTGAHPAGDARAWRDLSGAETMRATRGAARP